MPDPALLLALQAPLPPPPPNIVEERQWLSPAAETAKRNMERLVAGYEQALAGWKRQLGELRATTEATLPTTPFQSREREQIDQLIDDIEQHAENRAVQKARSEKQIRRRIKRLFQLEPAMAAVLRSLSERLIRVDVEAIEELLDYALFLRAFRAERVPEGRGGPVFEDAQDLARYLERTLA